jgi:hypothetical protein
MFPAASTLSILKIAGIGVVLVAGYLWVHDRGADSRDTEVAELKATISELKADHAEVLRDQANRALAVADAVRALQGIYLKASADAEQKFQQDKADAIAKKDRVIAGYRAGSLQLQDWWRCETPSAASDTADAAASAITGGDAGRADLRAASLAEGVQDGAVADAWIRWLQGELIATRATCGVPKSWAQ